MKSVRDYASDREYEWEVIVATISAIPRWKFARSVEAIQGSPKCSRFSRAKGSYFLACQEIVLGMEACAEFFINRTLY